MFDVVAGYARPAVASLLIDGSGRCREIGIGKGAQGNRDQAGILVEGVEERRTADRAEAEACVGALVADPRPVPPGAATVTRTSGKRACTANALPERCWQARQCQADTRTGSPVQRAVSEPQGQEAVWIVMASA